MKKGAGKSKAKKSSAASKKMLMGKMGSVAYLSPIGRQVSASVVGEVKNIK